MQADRLVGVLEKYMADVFFLPLGFNKIRYRSSNEVNVLNLPNPETFVELLSNIKKANIVILKKVLNSKSITIG